MAWEVKQQGQAVTFEVKVQPGAKKTEITGLWESALKLKIAAKPEDGAANRECIHYLSRCLGVSKQAVSIIRGEFARLKVVRVLGITKETVMQLMRK
ncbi:DUF167 domain-containing protein [bacterium]|nr:DUF167 domain-containing protein [bacterium]